MYTNVIYRIGRTLTILSLLFFFTLGSVNTTFAQSTKWVGTWSTAPQLVETYNNPPSPGLSNNTLRQVFRVSIGGDTLRMRFSNEFSEQPVTMKEVHLAVSTTGLDTIDTGTDTQLFFNGNEEVTMDAGGAVVSDPFAFDLEPLDTLAVSIHFGSTSPSVTGHPGSRTTSYILEDNAVTNEHFSGAVTTDHWYVINTLDVQAPDTAAAVAILGNSITDGRGSGTNEQNRWPDELANRLQANPETQHVGVLNQGIGGNCVLGDCLGPPAQSRFNRDIVQQSGVQWLIILEGINDIGYGSAGVGNDLISAYKQMIHTAHLNGIFVYGATLLPVKGNDQYYSEQKNQERQIVNEWIRSTEMLDGVIDMDKALRDPQDTLRMQPDAHDNDWLHPNEHGHQLMAEAVDLSLFTGQDTLEYSDNSHTFYYEPECGTVGADWKIVEDEQVSNGNYVTVKAGTESTDQAPTDSASAIYLPVTIDSSGSYSIFARLNNPTPDDDSFWVKVNDGSFEMNNNLTTSGWEWRQFSGELSQGEHLITIAYREDGAQLDKLAVTSAPYAPEGIGGEAQNPCTPTTTSTESAGEQPDGFALNQNYPNPFNPTTIITYQIPENSNVTLQVFDVMGRQVATLVDNVQAAGEYKVTFDGAGLSNGIYFYRLQTSTGFTKNRSMILMK